MRVKYLLPIAAIFSMTAANAAVAAPSPLSTGVSSAIRASAPVAEGESEQIGGAAWILGLLAVAAAVAGFAAASSDNDQPTSP